MQPLLQRLGLRAELTVLDSADFVVAIHGPDGQAFVGVERKTIPDLVQSLQSGRLQGIDSENQHSQLSRMVETYDYPWLLVEGSYTTDAQGRLCQKTKHHSLRPVAGTMSEDSLNKRILSLVLQGGLLLKETTSQAQSARWLASLARWGTEKAWSEHKTLEARHKPPQRFQISRFRERAMCLPDVGLALSKELEARCCGNERVLWGMTAAEFAALTFGTPPKQLGLAKAERIAEALRQLRGER